MNQLLLGLVTLLFFAVGAGARTEFGDDDMFRLTVTGAPPAFTREYDLDCIITDGVIHIPNIGEVKAVGLTASELASVIEKKLRDRKIFTEPKVVINVFGDPMITVGGAVRNPNRYPLTPKMTLSQALAMASDTDLLFHDEKVRLIRKGKITEYSRKAIRKDPALDPLLKPGDYVEGEGEF